MTVNSVESAQRILVAGCGAMGLPMAMALHKAGFDTMGFDNAPSEALRQAELNTVMHPQQANANVLIIVVRDANEINALCFNEQAMFASTYTSSASDSAPGRSYPQTVILSSTVSPRQVHELQARLPADVTLVDAPMSGAPLAAEQCALTFMLGGDNDTIDMLMPMFRAMGQQHFRLGPLGAGMHIKTLNNTVAATTVAVVRRVLADAHAAGIEPESLLAVMAASSGSTWFGNHLASINWAEENYSPDNTIGILEKDVLCALDALQREPDTFDQALLEALRKLPPCPPLARKTDA